MPTVDLTLVAYAFGGMAGTAMLVFFARGVRRPSPETWSAWSEGGTVGTLGVHGFPYPFGSQRVGTMFGPTFFGRRWQAWVAVLAVGTMGLATVLGVYVGGLLTSGGSLVAPPRAPEQILLTGGSPEALSQTLVAPPPGDWVEVPETGLHGSLSKDDAARAFAGRDGVGATDDWLEDTGFTAGYARSLGDPVRGRIFIAATLEFGSAEGAEDALAVSKREDARHAALEGLSDIPALPGAYHAAGEEGGARIRVAVLRRGAHLSAIALGGVDLPAEHEILDLAYLQYGHLDEVEVSRGSV